MKNMTRGIVFLLVALATPVIYGGEPVPGVTGVDVVVKQNPGKRTVTDAVTDARGNFDFEGLAPGSYTLAFQARKASGLRALTKNKVTVATSYLIKIEGTKRSVNQSGLTSDKLIEGVDIAIELGSGARLRGQVLAGAVQKFIWIRPSVGSHLPGHWADADSAEGVSAQNTGQISPNDLRKR